MAADRERWSSHKSNRHPGQVRGLSHANVRKWIDRRGGLSKQIILLKGRELAVIVPACVVR